jgi:hypothetical protein
MTYSYLSRKCLLFMLFRLVQLMRINGLTSSVLAEYVCPKNIWKDIKSALMDAISIYTNRFTLTGHSRCFLKNHPESIP